MSVLPAWLCRVSPEPQVPEPAPRPGVPFSSHLLAPTQPSSCTPSQPLGQGLSLGALLTAVACYEYSGNLTPRRT